jgi:hypothetical protein
MKFYEFLCQKVVLGKKSRTVKKIVTVCAYNLTHIKDSKIFGNDAAPASAPQH